MTGAGSGTVLHTCPETLKTEWTKQGSKRNLAILGISVHSSSRDEAFHRDDLSPARLLITSMRICVPLKMGQKEETEAYLQQWNS